MSEAVSEVLTEEEQAEYRLRVAGDLARGRHEDFGEFVTEEYVNSKLEDKEFNARIVGAEDPGEALYQAAVAEDREANSLESIVGSDAMNRPVFEDTRPEIPMDREPTLDEVLNGRR